MTDAKTITATLYAKRTYGVVNDPANPPIATFDHQTDNPFDRPRVVSWDGRVFLDEELAGFGLVPIVYYELHPVAVSATPITAA